MISEQVQRQAVWFHSIAHYSINVCMHCGHEDDPESARHWEEDEDGDRICNQCAAKETPDR